MNLTNMWFQPDGATCKTSRDKVNLLKEKFEGFIISRNGDINYPPRSCDLTPLGYFLWGYVMSVVYADKPRTVSHLKDNITSVIHEIEPQLCEKVIAYWVIRMHATKRSRGGHLNDIVFHR